ncbi:MAG: FHA domain-containing protein [Thermoanaerobaculia bacterium]
MTLRLGDCDLDLGARQLRRGDEPVHLTPKAFALLELLARERPRAVPRQEILDALWPDTFVGEGSISVTVAEVRRALGDSGSSGRLVRTVRGFGYALCPEESSETLAPGLNAAICRLVAWGLEQRWLAQGEHLIGRGEECDVRFDLASLSRRHARLTLAFQQATLVDLGSKNGTFVNGDQLTDGVSVPVAEGDEIRLGSIVFSLHWTALAGVTRTLAST